MGRKARGKREEPVARPSPSAKTGTGPFSSKTADLPAASTLRPIWLFSIVALWVATAIAYAGSLGTPFLLDDPINITKNPKIQLPLSLAALVTDPRALVTASLRLNYLLGEFSVTGYHVLNVVAHAIAGTLVFLLSRATFGLAASGAQPAGLAMPAPDPAPPSRSADALAAVVALVFLLHPMQTESVTYVIQRAEIFVGASLTAGLLAFAGMRRSATGRSLAALALACVAGCYSKPSFVVLPALLAVYDVCFLGRGRLHEMARRWPAYAVATVAAAWTFALTKLGGGFEAATAGFDIAGITPLDYLAAQFGVVVQYLRLALWPSRLCFDCGYRGAWPVHATVLGDSIVLPALILLALAAGSLVFWKRRPLVPFAILASAVVLLPTSSFVPLADFYVEHRMYLPIAFLAMAIVPAFHDGVKRLVSDAPVRRAIKAAAALVVILALGIATMRRNQLLADPVAMMEDSLAQAPGNERVQYNLANAYKRMGRPADAIPHYEAAIRIAPNVVRSYQNLGSLYTEQGRLDDALRVFLAGAAAKPDAGMAHRNVAMTYLRLGRPEEAFASARKSLEVEGGNPNGYRLLGLALEKLGRTNEAAEAYREGLAANPGDATLSERLAAVGQR